MNPITLFIIAASLFQGISSARNRRFRPQPADATDKPPLDRSWVPPEFQYFSDDDIRRIISNATPPPPLPRGPFGAPADTIGIVPNVDPNIFNYEAGKSAWITSHGDLEINDEMVYYNLPELDAERGYEIRIQDGILSVNGKVIFRNNPDSKFKLPFNYAYVVKHNLKSLRINVMPDGKLQVRDHNGNIIRLD